jgi:ABC-type transporter Mla maintaining outer membrane lipid asymmetry permease subunit MlaE
MALHLSIFLHTIVYNCCGGTILSDHKKETCLKLSVKGGQHMSIDIVLIIALIAFILGMIVGILLSRPLAPRY